MLFFKLLLSRHKQYNSDGSLDLSELPPRPSPMVKSVIDVTSTVDDDVVFNDLKLDDLDVVATLGIGGFGRVDLVRCIWDDTRIYALKSCSKAFIRSTQQENHINNERLVSKTSRSIFLFLTCLFFVLLNTSQTECLLCSNDIRFHLLFV